jgi:4-hydroxythreonine-4-phosphate dehydrogenase
MPGTVPAPTQPRIGICCGDPAGIGPEVTLKALAAEQPRLRATWRLLGDLDQLRQLNEQLGLQLHLAKASSPHTPHCIPVETTPGVSLQPTPQPGSPEAGHAALRWLETAARLCLRSELDALVSAPLNKAAVIRSGLPGFRGQTEYLTELAGGPPTTMMLLGHDDRQRWLRVALATTHLPLRQVADALNPQCILTAIEQAAQACHNLQLPHARVAVCGLNPHAGESGHLGTEEQTLIQPVVETAINLGIDATGPLPGDAVFHQAISGRFDAVVAMYHDQGLAPLKLLAFDTGVNWTLGLPFIRTAPDHGTAYDLAGRNQANPSSMQSAIRLAVQLAAARKS